MAEGVRLVEEAHRCGALIEWATATETDDSRAEALVEQLTGHTSVYITGRDSLANLLDTSMPQGVAAVCRIPETSLETLELPKRALVVICDSLRDPGNFGAVVRTASAAGCAAVIAAGESVDPWNPKAVRGSMGGVFRLPVVEAGSADELAGFLKEKGFSVFLADMRGENLFAIGGFPARSALIIGGEAEGAGRFTAGLESQAVSIPMASGAESLNAAVAAGIAIYHVYPRLGGRRAN